MRIRQARLGGPSSRAAQGAVLAAAMGCGSPRPLAPSAVLTGDWDFQYRADSPTVCIRMPGHQAGSHGAGRLEFLEGSGALLVARATGAFGFQNCGTVADGGIQGVVNVQLSGRQMEFRIGNCRLAATVPGAADRGIEGVAVCSVPEVEEGRGPGSMTRVR